MFELVMFVVNQDSWNWWRWSYTIFNAIRKAINKGVLSQVVNYKQKFMKGIAPRNYSQKLMKENQACIQDITNVRA